MSIEKELKEIQLRIEKGKRKAINPYSIEENVRLQLLVPLLQAMGYDTNNPDEMLFEYPSGFKNSTKVDCVILKEDKEFLLIEVKNIQENLRQHIQQTQGYFGSSKTAKFALLTNVKQLMFFSDFEHVNMMDDEPFYVIDVFNVTDEDLEFLKVFGRDNLLNHPEQVHQKAREIKAYTQREQLNQEFIQMLKDKGLEVSPDMIQIKNPLAKSESLISQDVIVKPHVVTPNNKSSVRIKVLDREIYLDTHKQFLKEFFELLIEKHPEQMNEIHKNYPSKAVKFSYNKKDFSEAYQKVLLKLSNGLHTSHSMNRQAFYDVCYKTLVTLGYSKEDFSLIEEKEEDTLI